MDPGGQSEAGALTSEEGYSAGVSSPGVAPAVGKRKKPAETDRFQRAWFIVAAAGESPASLQVSRLLRS